MLHRSINALPFTSNRENEMLLYIFRFFIGTWGWIVWNTNHLLECTNKALSSALCIRLYRWVIHDDVIKWKHFLRYCSFVPGIYRSPVTSPHTDKWRGVSMSSLICAWTNCWVNNRDSRHHHIHYEVTVMHSSMPSYDFSIKSTIFIILIWTINFP